jgi:hypothetical protein
MHTDERVGRSGDISHHERDVLHAVDHVAESDSPELARGQRDAGLAHPNDQALVLAPVSDQLGDRDQWQTVLASEFEQPRQPRHLAVGAGDFAQHAGRLAAGDAAQVERGLCVSSADEDASLARSQWEHVPWTGEIVGGG